MNRNVLEGAKLAVRLEADVLEGLRNNHSLLQVVRIWDTVKGLEAVHGGGALSRLVRNHTTDATL